MAYIAFILGTQYHLQRERKEKKSGAAVSHAKLAEKLLAAQMRREALSHTDSQ
jgi:DNA excision repair protein ERCC-5